MNAPARSAEWWRDAVVYQIYVRSMADGNGDGRGDLTGIADRIDHLHQLGVDAIWLTPCFPSPQHDHGYDVADYVAIEPTYGTLHDLDRLVESAREHDIKVLLDIVPNHCSIEHAWFRAALSAGRGSPERERFWFRDGRGESGELPPNNWPAIFGGPAWTRVTEPDGSLGQWYLHVFTPWQPDWNWHHPDVVEQFDDVLRFWLDRGVEGFRVDAPAVVGKDPGLPDISPLPAGLTNAEVMVRNPYVQFHPSGHEVWRHWRTVIDEYEATHPGRVLVTVSEIYGPVEQLRAYLGGDEFHQSFAFEPMLATWRADTLREAVAHSFAELDGLPATPAWTLNNHDTQRIVTRLGRANVTDPAAFTGNNLVYVDAPIDLTVGTRRARAAIATTAALPGALYLYYGEELGLEEHLDLPDDRREDPLFVRTDGRERGRDGCRIPMPWTIDPRGADGFSSDAGAADPWLPQPEGWARLSVEAERTDPGSMLSFYRSVLAERRTLSGDFAWVDHPDLAGTLAFERGDVLVVLNPSAGAVAVPGDLLDGRVPFVSSALDEGAPQHEVPADACVWFR